jgi:hypothetical protein
MKNRLLVLLCAMVALSPFAASNSVAGVSVGFSVSMFEGPLSQCGYWIDRAPYGRCWYPAYVSSSWRPYCNGYWMWTEDGWYWVSDEPWAWACYHYGRWVYDSYYGWIWVPDTVWGPSWVAWRSSDEYVGWAPLSPECRFGAGGEFVFREEFIRPSAFVFVDVHHFSDHIRPHTVIVNNVTIINKTVNVTKIRRVNNVVVNNGPHVDIVQRFTPRKFTEPPVRTPRWSGFSTPPHPALEVLQPSAVRAREQAEGRSTPERRLPEVIRPRAAASKASPAPKRVIEEDRPKNERGARTVVTEQRPITSPAPVQRERGGSSGEQKYQNFDPRPYPYGKVSGSSPPQVRSAAPAQRGRNDQPPASSGDRGPRRDKDN